jgi:branched-chain amino acid transport system ATP-binding protein
LDTSTSFTKTPRETQEALLEIKDLNVAYGKAQVIHNASLRVNKGEFVALLGRNGAGKSTLLNAACALIPKLSGSVHFLGSNITNYTSQEVVSSSLIQVLEGHRVFQNLSVEDNLLIGTYSKNHKGDRSKLERIYELFPELREHKSKLGSQLSGGQQQILAVGQGVIAEPKLLILDEPSSGLAPIVIDRILNVASDLCAQGVAILLVEQLVDKALKHSNYVYLLEAGSIVAEGDAQEMRSSEMIKHVYLGSSD